MYSVFFFYKITKQNQMKHTQIRNFCQFVVVVEIIGALASDALYFYQFCFFFINFYRKPNRLLIFVKSEAN